MDQSQGFTSIHEIINEVFNIFDTEDIAFSTLVESAANGLLLIGSFSYTEDKTASIEICDYRGVVPCDVLYINQTKNEKGIAMKYATDSFHIHNSNSPDLYKKSKYSYTINGDHIFASFKEGHVIMNYRSMPVDDKGYPLIPNDIKFREAIKYHLMYTIAQKLFYKGKITENVYRDIEVNRNWYIGGAQARDKMLSHDQMESLSNQFTRLIQDSSAFEDFYASDNLKQQQNVQPYRR